MNARILAMVFLATCAVGANVALGSRSARAEESTIHARGQVLAIAPPYVVFVTGDAFRLYAGTTVPADVTLGSTVLVTIDRASHDIVALARDARADDAIDIAEIPRDFVVVAPKSARVVAPDRVAATLGAARGPLATAPGVAASVTLAVTVPANTPPADDVYVSTDRSNFSPAEVRMERIDSRRFTATVPLGPSGRLRYQYTRGTYASVERDRSGGIVAPHVADGASARHDDTVIRWADTN